MIQKEESYVNNENRADMIERNLRILRGLPQEQPKEEEKVEIKIQKPKFTKEYKNYSEKQETQDLDDILLGTSVDVIKKDRSGITMPLGYKTNDDLLVDPNDLLLSKPISSILDNDVVEEKTSKYRSDGLNASTDTRTKTIDINNI